MRDTLSNVYRELRPSMYSPTRLQVYQKKHNAIHNTSTQRVRNIVRREKQGKIKILYPTQ